MQKVSQDPKGHVFIVDTLCLEELLSIIVLMLLWNNINLGQGQIWSKMKSGSFLESLCVTVRQNVFLLIMDKDV